MKCKTRVGFLLITTIILSFAATGFTATSQGAEFPAKAITIIVGASAGSSADLVARELAKQMEKILRKPVVVQIRAGGSQAEMLSHILSQPADGYVLGTVTTSTAGALAGHLREQFKKGDFSFLALVQSDPYMLVVKETSPFADLKGLIEFAKTNPGKVKVGGFGMGSGHHMSFLDLCDRADAQMRWVSFDGAPGAIAATLGGHVDGADTNLGLVKGHVQAGKMRVLAVASEKRLEFLPNVPTYKEQGIDLVLFQWRGLAMRAGAPKTVTDKLIGTISQATKTPEFRQYMKNTGQLEIDLTGEKAQKYVTAEIEQTSERLKSLGILQ
jgi:tripartite-type tricarboxylate transporter receptor subunit TctC